MTARNEAQSTNVPQVLGDHQRRIQILEGVVPASGAYLQARGANYSGWDLCVPSRDSQYNGGNGASWYDGDWTFIDDATSPFGGVALETTTDGDWFPFALGNLGPQGTGYGVGFFFYGATDNAQIDFEFATTSVDEFGNTSPATGTSTSVLAADDFEYWDATPPDWYNNGSLDAAHGYRFDLSDTLFGWTQRIINISTFNLTGADGTPLTANGGASPDWEDSGAFNGGGGPDLEWWMRVKVSGPGITGSGGFRVRIGQIWLYRLNSQQDFVG